MLKIAYIIIIRLLLFKVHLDHFGGNWRFIRDWRLCGALATLGSLDFVTVTIGHGDVLIFHGDA
jgi:hypothetical protein